MIIQNAIKTPDGTFLRSLNNHHFVSHKDKNGETYFRDGGFSYIRGTLNQAPPESYDLSEESTWGEICERILIDVSPDKNKVEWKPLGEASDKEIREALKKLDLLFGQTYGWNIGISIAAMTYKLLNK